MATGSSPNRVFVVRVGMTKFEKPGSRDDFDYPDMAKVRFRIYMRKIHINRKNKIDESKNGEKCRQVQRKIDRLIG